LKVIYDPNRTAKVGLVFYYNGLLSYVLLTEGLSIGSKISSNFNVDKVGVGGSDNVSKNLGASCSIGALPLGTLLHSVEMYPNMGAQVARSAGVTALLYRKTNDLAYVKLKSG